MGLNQRLERLFYNRCPSRFRFSLAEEHRILPQLVIAEDGCEITTFRIVPEQCNVRLPVLIHLHGNYGDVQHHSKYILPLLDCGFEVWMWDYRGYGLTQGTAQHDLVFRDSQQIVNHCSSAESRAERKLVLFGQSLGGHIAINLASRMPQVQGLIFDCAFTSFIDIAKFKYPIISWLASRIVNQPYSAIDVIGELQIPILAMHSQLDLSVPLRMGQALYGKIVHERKQNWWYSGGHLHSYLHPREFTTKVLEFIEQYNLLSDE